MGRGLARRSLGGWSLSFFAIGASAPLTAVGGGVVSAFGATGVVGVPAAFPLLMAALGLALVGLVRMSRHVPHAGPLYAHVAQGLGPVAGAAAAALALVSYAAVQVCLFGLVGATLGGYYGGPWWLWAMVVWLLIALVGAAPVRAVASVLAALLVVELLVVLGFDLVAFAHPAGGGVSAGLLLPTALSGSGIGGVLALAVACFVGVECVSVYSEEARSHGAVVGATFGSLLVVGVLYAVSAWAVVVVSGPDRVVAAAGELGPDLIFAVLREHAWPVMAELAQVLLVTSIVAAMLSFHSTVARYAFAMGRDGMLPARFGRVRVGWWGGVPVAGSVLQSVIGAVVIVGAAVFGVDPINGLFTTGGAVAAVGVLVLLFLGCVAVVRFFRHGGGTNDGIWVRVLAPAVGGAGVGLVLAVVMSNVESLVGGSGTAWVVPTVIGAVVVTGVLWGLALRGRAGVQVGRGEPEPLAEPEHHLTDVLI